MSRPEARSYIEAYNKRPDANPVLLEVAKWDFNKAVEEYGLANKLSVARDRLMESYFWTVGMVYEPQCSNLRKDIAKVVPLITVIDDVYDVYGTLEELELFTDAVGKAELERGETANSIFLCIMSERGRSEEPARQYYQLVIILPSQSLFVETTINLARIAQMHLPT
ncbi:Squalene/phytoene synthase [Parasponia andersonii]|uniref:Squalene/phytoene synthase n=1 Tax=Parasponia andersonii TaxID=3476 RepID=A0A2P5BID3_PARAD|nr:Squalene/phytoene synthase [Parasponia andersonii]